LEEVKDAAEEGRGEGLMAITSGGKGGGPLEPPPKPKPFRTPPETDFDLARAFEKRLVFPPEDEDGI